MRQRTDEQTNRGRTETTRMPNKVNERVSVCLLSDDWWYLISFSPLSTGCYVRSSTHTHKHTRSPIWAPHIISHRFISYFPFCSFFDFICSISLSILCTFFSWCVRFLPLLSLNQLLFHCRTFHFLKRAPYLNFLSWTHHSWASMHEVSFPQLLWCCFAVRSAKAFSHIFFFLVVVTIRYIYIGTDTRYCNHFVVWSFNTLHFLKMYFKSYSSILSTTISICRLSINFVSFNHVYYSFVATFSLFFFLFHFVAFPYSPNFIIAATECDCR